jgi:hypothetical protein
MLAAQYDKILSVATLPTVTIYVLPFEAEANTVHIHPFVIYEQADGTATVTVETYTRELTLTDPEEVRYYRQTNDKILARALRGQSAHDLIRSMHQHLLSD